MNKINLLKILCGVLILLVQASAWGSSAQVLRVRVSACSEKTRLVFDLSRKVDYRLIMLAPEAIKIELTGATIASAVSLKNLVLAKTSIKRIVAIKKDDSVSFNLELQQEICCKHFLLANPERLVIDLLDIRLNRDLLGKPLIKNTTVKTSEAKMTSGLKSQAPVVAVTTPATPSPETQPDANTDVSQPIPEAMVKTKVSASEVTTSNNSLQHSPESDQDNDSQNDINASVEATNEQQVPAVKKKLPSMPAFVAVGNVPQEKQRDIVVVIDPGHGGKDPGATGNHGVREKDVVFCVARYLQAEINKTRGFKAVLTRKGDYFLSLRQRLDIAHRYNADMFIAIHADAFKAGSGHSHGASVFALSQRGATSEAARWLADRENESELGQAMSDKSSVLRSVLIDLAQTATIGASLEIGNAILNQLEYFSHLHSSRVEQAAFVVLKSPDIPSLLVETGFLSDPHEEAKLRDPGYQKKLANALSNGIEDYFVARPLPGTYLSFKKHMVKTL